MQTSQAQGHVGEDSTGLGRCLGIIVYWFRFRIEFIRARSNYHHTSKKDVGDDSPNDGSRIDNQQERQHTPSTKALLDQRLRSKRLRSPDVLTVPALGRHPIHTVLAVSRLGQQARHRRLHVGRHLRGVAAHVDMRALLD